MRINAADQGLVGKSISALRFVDETVQAKIVSVAEGKVGKSVVAPRLANRNF